LDRSWERRWPAFSFVSCISDHLVEEIAKSKNGAIMSSIQITKHSEAYWRVTFDIPPLNIFGPANIPQLEQVVSSLENDDRVKVVVFDSAVDGFFLTHYDFLAPLEESTKFPPGRTGLQPLPDMLARLSRAPVVSVALIRGRATGVGSELALACDMRFASLEKAVLSQWRRTDGPAAETYGARKSVGSVVNGKRYWRRVGPTLRVRQSVSSR
jgi:1,4-dihydroxy-2-naphthoyl-CoA synthase